MPTTRRLQQAAVVVLNATVPPTYRLMRCMAKRHRREIPYALLVIAFAVLLFQLPPAMAQTTQTPPETILDNPSASQVVSSDSQPLATNSQPPTIEERIRTAAHAAGVDADRAVAIAQCESALNPEARNWQGSTAKGLFQFTDPTWRYIKASGHQFDIEENIRQFMIHYPKHPQWWACDSIVGK